MSGTIIGFHHRYHRFGERQTTRSSTTYYIHIHHSHHENTIHTIHTFTHSHKQDRWAHVIMMITRCHDSPSHMYNDANQHPSIHIPSQIDSMACTFSHPKLFGNP